MPDTLMRLVDITMRSMHVYTPDRLNGPAHGKIRLFDGSVKNNRIAGADNVLDLPRIALATAQRVDMPAKITASIR